MTVSIELPLYVEDLLREVAKHRGTSLEEVIADRINLNFSEDELEDLEDELDIAAVRRAREEDDPADYKTLDDLRAHIANRGKQ